MDRASQGGAQASRHDDNRLILFGRRGQKRPTRNLTPKKKWMGGAQTSPPSTTTGKEPKEQHETSTSHDPGKRGEERILVLVARGTGF